MLHGWLQWDILWDPIPIHVLPNLLPWPLYYHKQYCAVLDHVVTGHDCSKQISAINDIDKGIAYMQAGSESSDNSMA